MLNIVNYLSPDTCLHYTCTHSHSCAVAQLDKRALEQIALGETDDPNLRLLKVSLREQLIN